MKIGGFQYTSLLDYPDCISAIIWTVGCNFRCPFCYNKTLVEGNAALISEEEIFSFLHKRKGVIEALVISGGEPLLQKDIVPFIRKVKQLGYLVKIDTNGSFPKILEQLLDENLVDYVAMDVKAPKNKYAQLAGVKTNISTIRRSVDIIMQKAKDYEFKTTFAPDLLKKEDIISIAKWLKGAKKFYLQQFKGDVPVLSSNYMSANPYSKEYLMETLEAIQPYFTACGVRGV